MVMDWTSLRDFLIVAQQGSVSRAARALGLSQPALSRRLARLEEALGISLFVRSPRGLGLTAAGERVRALAEQMQLSAEQVADAARAGHDPVSGVVSISAPEAGLGTEWLPRALLPLRREHPGLRVEIQVSNQLVDLARRAADIAIRAVRPSEPALTARRVARVSFGLFAARAYLEKHPAPGALRELADHDLIAYEQGLDGRQRGWLARWAPPERVVLATNSVDASFRAARAGWGIAILPVISAGSNADLARVLPETEVVSFPIWLVTHAELGKSPRIRAVFQRLVHAFERDRDAFAGGSTTTARKGRVSRP